MSEPPVNSFKSRFSPGPRGCAGKTVDAKPLLRWLSPCLEQPPGTLQTNKATVPQWQPPELWAHSPSVGQKRPRPQRHGAPERRTAMQRHGAPESRREGQRCRGCSPDPPGSPYRSDDRGHRRRRAFRQMVSNQGAAEKMLTSRRNGGRDPRDDSVSCSRLFGRDSGRRSANSLSRFIDL